MDSESGARRPKRPARAAAPDDTSSAAFARRIECASDDDAPLPRRPTATRGAGTDRRDANDDGVRASRAD